MIKIVLQMMTMYQINRKQKIDHRKKILYTNDDGTVITNPLYRQKNNKNIKDKKSKKLNH